MYSDPWVWCVGVAVECEMIFSCFDRVSSFNLLLEASNFRRLLNYWLHSKEDFVVE